jgi:hypothetical protein
MSVFADLFTRLRLAPNDAEVIFDRDEPVGQATDLVMPRRRWFRRSESTNDRRPGATSTARVRARRANRIFPHKP